MTLTTLIIAMTAVISPGVSTLGPNPCATSSEWPLWDTYVSAFVSPDGRVVDPMFDDHSTSEGQAYALFFALVNDDRPLFSRILTWTQNNLAEGNLRGRLPAWRWGRLSGGGWGILDENAASDADTWISYILLEAGRLWSSNTYGELGTAMLQRIVTEEVTDIPGQGPMLLPGPLGFAEEDGSRRMNLSYLPPQLLRRFALEQPTGPWANIENVGLKALQATAPHGLVADWVAFDTANGFTHDPVTGPIGSYDAIRTYLWSGMLSATDRLASAWRRQTSGMYRHWADTGVVPEHVRTDSGENHKQSHGSVGFLATLLPEAVNRGDVLAQAQISRAIDAARMERLSGVPNAYYDHNLTLFATGYGEGRFSFDSRGRLQPSWGTTCTGS